MMLVIWMERVLRMEDGCEGASKGGVVGMAG